MKKKRFRYTGKRKNPVVHVDAQVLSDRFDLEPDRVLIVVWAGGIMRPMSCFCYKLEGF